MALWVLKLTAVFVRGYHVSTGLGSSTCDQLSLICIITNPLKCDNSMK